MTGFSLAFLMDPMPLLTRFYTFFLYPLAITVVNLFLDLLRPLSQNLGWVTVSHLHYPQPVYYMSAITLLIFGGIIALNRIAPRFWCRYLCPLGAFLSLISPLGLFKRRVNEDCNECLKCREKLARWGPLGRTRERPVLPSVSSAEPALTSALRRPSLFPPLFPWGGEYSIRSISPAGGLSIPWQEDWGSDFWRLRLPFTFGRSKHQLIRPPGAIPETRFPAHLHPLRGVHEVLCDQYASTLSLGIRLSGLWTPKTGPSSGCLRTELQCLRQGLSDPGHPLPLPGREDPCQDWARL